MPARRAALALLGGTLTAALSGCLGNGTDDSAPTTVTNRPVDATGSVPQYQVDAQNGGRLDGPTPSSPTVAWRRTPARYDASQPVVDGDAVYVGFDGDL